MFKGMGIAVYFLVPQPAGNNELNMRMMIIFYLFSIPVRGGIILFIVQP